jgi:PKD repeat protein
MQKKSLLSLVIMLFIPFLMRAEWIPLNKQTTLPTPPNVTLISDDNNSTVLKIEISGFELKDFISGENHYQMMDLLSESFTTIPGFPELPYIAKVLAIPDQAGVSVEVLETGEIQSFNNINLLPARASWLEGSPETPYTENTDAYNSMSAFPGEFVKFDPPSIFRDFRIARVSAFPLRYIPAKKEIQAVSSITVRINYGPGEVINPKTSAKKLIAPSFGELYRNFIFNYQSVLDKLYGGKENGHELMLCIMPDEFITSFQIYADWKRQSGIDIHVTKFSDIGANGTNPDIIKTHIADAYHNWEVPPTYVLIVGDDGVFPKKLVTLDGWTFPNEDFFVEIDGNDYFPELMIGRFTNQGDYRMQVMINKFIKYEKNPYTANTDWFKKGICCSNNAYASQVETKRFAANIMVQDGGFTSVDTMMSDPQCTYDINDIVNAINDGRSFLNYRGEGWYSGWSTSCYDFSPDVITNNVTNGEKFTFVTSIGCGVAGFDASGGNCFGEEWVEVGSLTSPKGAPAFIGPTSNTHTAYNNNIDRGIYKGMFQEGLETPGQALLRGKLEMYNVFGGGDFYVSYHYKIYCVLGDPSIHIWKEVPREVTANYAASIPFGNNLVEFTVNFTATGQPVANALVCVTGNTIFSTGYTDETGKAYLDITAEVAETLNVTVRGGNVIPFLGTLSVVQPTGPYVIRDSYTLNDVTGGNGNGIMETSETILASVTIKNVGTEEAANVLVTIESSDEFVTITDNTESYGTILAGATAVVTDGFGWEVANNIPDLQNVIFEMTATDGTGTWTSFFSVVGHGPKIEFGAMIIDDALGNGNGRLDPGETVNLIIPTFNNGTYQAVGAVGSLNCSSGFINLNNASYDFNVIGAGLMEEAIFSVTVAANAPIGTAVSFIYDVTSGGYYLQESIAATIGLIVEDWETGDMSQFDWTTGGSSNWAVTTNNPYEGSYCIKSGALGNNQNNYLSLQYEIIAADSISFWYKVSSEEGYDFLKFYIDNDVKSSWSGELGWARAAYVVTAGVHTFKWTYSKDQSAIGGSDCSWVDYILLPAAVFQASFSSTGNNICEDAYVSFYDNSAGATSWDWVFEGGTPATSTLPNPVIEYLIPGIYDVSLTASNGTTTNTLVVENYVTVSALPGTPSAPTGPTTVCASGGNTTYSTEGLTGITSYNWVLEPVSAGNVSGTGLNATVLWASGFLGDVTLKVAGENICGTGAYSNPINITRYLPEVTLEPFDWVCVGWPAFELTGGMPEGGEYSGTGVENGWFNPASAGVGTHTITYTYSDANNCENYATETILVDPCTGINEMNGLSGIKIYPNPTTGIITIGFDQNIGNVEVTVVNTLNKVVYFKSTETIPVNSLNIDLSSLSKGIYFIKLKSDKIEKTIKIILQ